MPRGFRVGLCFVAFAVLTSCNRNAGPVAGTPIATEPGDPKLARAVVMRDQVTVTIPVGRRPVWRWNLDETPKNHREYQWEVVAPGMGAFGFSLFKFPDTPPKEGKLADLLNQGQANMWEALPNNGGQLVQEVSVSVRSSESDSAVAIVVNDRSTITQLLAKRPATVEIFARAPLAAEQRYTIPIEYRDR